MITITPISEKTFAIRDEAVYDNGAFGYKGWSSWSGELIRMKDGRYVSQSISMYTTSSDIQPPPNSFELDVVRGWMEFIGCNKIRMTYDLFGGYFDLNKRPFVDPLEINYLPPEGLTETYHRMPAKCPVCTLPAVSTTTQPRLRR